MEPDHASPAKAEASVEDPLYRKFIERDSLALLRVEKLVARVVSFRGYGIPREMRPDLVQEALLQIWQECSKPAFVFRDNFGAFARMVASRRCLDHRRARRSESPLSQSIPDDGPSPELILLRKERAERATEILSQLRQECRELIRLHILEGRSYREVSLIWTRTEGALRTQMYQCLEEAREIRKQLSARRVSTSRDCGADHEA